MAASYNHIQTTSSLTWSVPHNLNSPAIIIDVFVDELGNLEKIIPDIVEHVDNNNVLITFTSSRTGNARIVI